MAHTCVTLKTAQIIGKKWAVTILQEVSSQDKKGFNYHLRQLRKISPKILAKRLRELEQQDLIERKIIKPTKPPQTSYSTTEKGKELLKIVNNLSAWSNKYNKGDIKCRSDCPNCPMY